MRCGITGSKGVLGNRLSKFKDLKFIKFNGDITKKKEVDNWIKKIVLTFLYIWQQSCP